jgi:hypothetical protein
MNYLNKNTKKKLRLKEELISKALAPIYHISSCAMRVPVFFTPCYLRYSLAISLALTKDE